MGWPQWVYAGLLALSLGYSLAKDGEPKTGNHSFVASLVATALAAGLLYAGGFWGAH